MGNRLLLVFHADPDKRLSIGRLPPLGILYLSSYLEKHGIRADIIDSSTRPFSLADVRPYDLIGFSINISNRECTLDAVSRIKNTFPEKRIIVGGPLSTCNPELFLRDPNLDAVFVGEGEESLLEYLRLAEGNLLKGVYIKKGENFLFQGPREPIKNLDALPFPALDKVNMRKYNNSPKKRLPISSMITSRGCPYQCIYCSHSMGRAWRPRSAEDVVAEMKWQVETFGVQEICIFDDNFSLDKKRAAAICDLLVEEKLPLVLQFTNGLRVDCLDADLLAKLKKAKTWLVGLAPESGNPEILKKIKKGFGLSEVLAVRETCRKLGLATFGFFMIGFPFETKADILATIDFAKRLDTEIVEFNKVIPYPETELHEMMVRDGTLVAGADLQAKSYHDGPVATHKVGDLEGAEVKSLIRKSYREYYLRPRILGRLLKTFSLRDLWGLARYAVRTRNI